MRILNAISEADEVRSAPVLHRRILIADDDAAMRNLLHSELERLGYDVDEVATGVEVINCFTKAVRTSGSDVLPELVVCDLRMAGFSGLQVLDNLREAGFRVPFILITAFGDEWVREKAIRFGAMAVLDKPFEIEELALLIGKLLDRS